MQKNCQDTMSVVTHKGKPDLFVTITMNPMCREVIENLLPGQTRNDRPDLVARVFKQKLDELINDIKKIIFSEYQLPGFMLLNYKIEAFPMLTF